MSLIIDSCSLINLVKAGLSDPVRDDPCMKLIAGPVVRNEAWGVRSDGIVIPRELVADIDEEVDAEELVTFMDQYRIGPGEAESIILAQRFGFFLFCDDRKGRMTATTLLGEERVVGTLGLALHQARELGDGNETFNRYQGAIEEGAFLPAYTRDSFCEAVATCRLWPCGPECLAAMP